MIPPKEGYSPRSSGHYSTEATMNNPFAQLDFHPVIIFQKNTMSMILRRL